MEWRNPAYNRLGTIDVEINHPQYGWIPFTANPSDEGAAFDVAEMYSQIVVDGAIAPYVPPPPAPVAVPAEITKVQFVRAMRQMGLWDAMQATIEAHPDWPYITAIPRSDPMTLAMAAAMGATEGEIDNIWLLGKDL